MTLSPGWHPDTTTVTNSPATPGCPYVTYTHRLTGAGLLWLALRESCPSPGGHTRRGPIPRRTRQETPRTGDFRREAR
ncbi:hypothetical protein Cme02nite_72570 [Catellatospora methionotrophica]|uniref:Uncharacterized protein n=1 Tax=Catellatospora methionotrophica TaxID=121620 RepID=A0A8J3LQG3_9ACTN|nr:hypothetical protein Cme02nite_72570 [Catellatospora methionotrophica]